VQVRAALGIRKTVVSGGGSLAAHLDAFFEAVGLPVINGWGLTETSPVLACRR
jgi:long-chain acyl-CoA synthetase